MLLVGTFLAGAVIVKRQSEPKPKDAGTVALTEKTWGAPATPTAKEEPKPNPAPKPAPIPEDRPDPKSDPPAPPTNNNSAKPNQKAEEDERKRRADLDKIDRNFAEEEAARNKAKADRAKALDDALVASPDKSTQPPASQKASPSPPEAPRLTVKLIPIKSYSAVYTWGHAGVLKGQHVRLTGEAEVKRTYRGVYAVFMLPTGRQIATVSVNNEDAEVLRGIKVDESAKLSVNLETTIKGTSSGQLVLADSEFLPLDAPEGFVSLEEPTAETWKTTAAKGVNPAPSGTQVAELERFFDQLRRAKGANPAPSGTQAATPTNPILIGTDSKPVSVRGYYNKKGTFVQAHSRASPGTGTGRR